MQSKRENVRQEKTKEDMVLQQAGEKKKKDSELKAKKHAETVAAGDNRKEAVEAVHQRNHVMGDAGRQFRAQADEIVCARTSAIVQYNQEQAMYVRESTRQAMQVTNSTVTLIWKNERTVATFMPECHFQESQQRVQKGVAASAAEIKQEALVRVARCKHT